MSKIVGVCILIVNVSWLIDTCTSIYQYEYTEIDFYLRIPYWIISLHIIASFIGIAIGMKTYLKSIPPLKAIGLNVAIGIIVFSIEFLFTG